VFNHNGTCSRPLLCGLFLLSFKSALQFISCGSVAVSMMLTVENFLLLDTYALVFSILAIFSQFN